MVFDIYKNKKVFITGHTGFKGSWLSIWLKLLGADVFGYALKPNTTPSMFESLDIKNKISKSVYGDILEEEKLSGAILDFKPDIVFHLAAQPLVRKSYTEPVLTYKTNVIGTLNVLEAARKCDSVKAFVNITTDKCYENREVIEGYKENDSLGGYDMYSSSKACSEILSASYRRSFLSNGGFALATARAGNVIGGGDWAEDRLIPDCVKSIISGNPVIIRNPNSIRPWQHVLEPLSGYLLLGEKLLTCDKKYADCFNFGPEMNAITTVREVSEKFIKYYGKGELIIGSDNIFHEMNILRLNIEKSKDILGWKPLYDVDKAVKITADWYKAFYDKSCDIYEFTVDQIKNYEGNK